jgi:hypothetical protein
MTPEEQNFFIIQHRQQLIQRQIESSLRVINEAVMQASIKQHQSSDLNYWMQDVFEPVLGVQWNINAVSSDAMPEIIRRASAPLFNVALNPELIMIQNIEDWPTIFEPPVHVFVPYVGIQPTEEDEPSLPQATSVFTEDNDM